jgi:hypothetical protein
VSTKNCSTTMTNYFMYKKTYMNENNYLLRVHNNLAKFKLLKSNLMRWKDTLELSTSSKRLRSSRYRIRRQTSKTLNALRLRNNIQTYKTVKPTMENCSRAKNEHRRQIDDSKGRITCNKLQRHAEYDTLAPTKATYEFPPCL